LVLVAPVMAGFEVVTLSQLNEPLPKEPSTCPDVPFVKPLSLVAVIALGLMVSKPDAVIFASPESTTGVAMPEAFPTQIFPLARLKLPANSFIQSAPFQ